MPTIRPLDHLATLIHARTQASPVRAASGSDAKSSVAPPAASPSTSPAEALPVAADCLEDKDFTDIVATARAKGPDTAEAIEALVHISCWKGSAVASPEVPGQAPTALAPEARFSHEATRVLLELYGDAGTPQEHRDCIRTCVSAMVQFVGDSAKKSSPLPGDLLEPIPAGLLYLVGQSPSTDQKPTSSLIQPGTLAPMIETSLAQRLGPPSNAGGDSWLRRANYCFDEQVFASPVWGCLKNLERASAGQRQTHYAGNVPMEGGHLPKVIADLVREVRAAPFHRPRVALASNGHHWVTLVMQQHPDGTCHAVVVDTLAASDGSRTGDPSQSSLGSQLAEHLRGSDDHLTVTSLYRNLQSADMGHDCAPLCLEVVRFIDQYLAPRAGSGMTQPVVGPQLVQSLAEEIDKTWCGGSQRLDACLSRLNPVMVARRAEMIDERARVLADDRRLHQTRPPASLPAAGVARMGTAERERLQDGFGQALNSELIDL